MMFALAAGVTAACGQKGPPLPPLHLVPAAVSEISVRRVGDQVRLRFVLPTRNENGPGRLELDRVQIFAMTIAASAPEPSPRELLSKDQLVGEIAVRPVLAEGETAPPDEQRPEPGSPVSFDETLNEQKLTPVTLKLPPPPVAPPAAAPAGAVPPAATPPAAATAPAAGAPPAPATAAAPAAQSAPAPTPYTRRIYVARGLTRGGRPGGVSTRVAVPITPLPPPPQGVSAKVTETAVVLAWAADASVQGYNVYRGTDLLQPLNPAPLTAPPFEHGAAKFGEEQCYRIRAVTVIEPVTVEGEPSAAECVTPRDQFPPAAPKGLAAVPTAGQISLIWDANTEKDLGGYIVLRGEAPDGALTAVTPAPIRETSYRDTTVKPGTRYVYAIVAVDAAAPPNMSAQSARVEETAR